MKVREPFVFTHAISAVCLPRHEPSPGDYGIVTGWGEIQGNLVDKYHLLCSQPRHFNTSAASFFGFTGFVRYGGGWPRPSSYLLGMDSKKTALSGKKWL